MPRDRNIRRDLERLANKAADRLKDLLRGRPDVCFAAMMFHVGPKGFTAYSSNAKRVDMIKSLRELADHLEADDTGSGPEFYAAAQKIIEVARDMDASMRRKLPAGEDPWMVAMKSYEAGRQRFEKTGDRMIEQEDTATEGQAQSLTAWWTASLIQMSAALLLAVRHAPIDPSKLETFIRRSDEVH